MGTVDIDSDDDDLFVIKQIKPVNKITKAEALKIKEDLIGKKKDEDVAIEEIDLTDLTPICNNTHSEEINNENLNNLNGNHSKTVNAVASNKKLEDKKKLQNTSTPSKKRKSSTSPGKSIKDYFTPTKQLLNGNVSGGEKKISSGEKSSSSPVSSSKKIKFSPNILKRSKKFKLKLDLDVDNASSESNVKVKNSPSPKKSSPSKPSQAHNEVYNVCPIPSTSKNPPSEFSEAQNIFPVPSTSETFPNQCRKEVTMKEEVKTDNLFILNNLVNPNLSNSVASASKTQNKPKPKSPPKEKRLSDGPSKSSSDNSRLNCDLFRKLMHDEMKRQLLLEGKSREEGDQNFERLLSFDELDTIDRFFKLDYSAQQLFVRIYARQHKDNWYRLCNMKYEDISSDLANVVNILRDSQFFRTNVEDSSLVEQINLLKKNEIQFLCKGFNVNLSILSTAKKEVLIEGLLDDNKKQRSVLDMMCNNKSNKSSRLELLKAETKKALGVCFKLNEKIVETFNRIVLLYSLVYQFDDETNRIGDTLYFLFKIHVGQEKYITYPLSPTVIFKKREDFLKYEKALQLRAKMESALNAKNFETFEEVAKEAKREFEALLKDQEYLDRFTQQQHFLKRYSAGSVYSGILTAYCEKFKTRTKKRDIVDIGKLLLEQNYFGLSKKGKWYELSVQAYEALRYTDLAGKLLIVAFKDEHINEVMKLTLQLRGKALLKRKTNAIEDVELKMFLEDMCLTTAVPEPLTREISARALEGTAGFKSVYVTKNESGTSYSSVEEQALYHYKREDGFEQGIHAEGMLIQTIYFLLFFDIIYQTAPPGVFQSPHQATPLDFASSSFYTSRQELIDARLEEMNFWTFEDILEKIRKVYYDNFNTICCVSWKEEFTPELFCDIIKCIGIEPTIAICRRLVNNFRVFRSGFPDLTLWNTKTKKVKFVEVKSPNDRLSPNQRIWLNYLKNIGLDCEVCNVKNVGGKKLRS